MDKDEMIRKFIRDKVEYDQHGGEDEIIELETEEVSEEERELDEFFEITKTINITSKPKISWEDVAELWDQDEIEEDE